MNQYEHGGDIYKNKVKYDFSANINPLGMPENVKKVLKDNIDRFERYPDTNCTQLKNLISKKYRVLPENIVCGNGAIDILYKAIRVINPTYCLLAVPCFSEYEKSLLENGSKIKYYFRKEENDYKMKEDYLEYMDDIDMLILCQPNNPTGDLIGEELLFQIFQKAIQKNIIVIIDECFIDFVSIKWEEMKSQKRKDEKNDNEESEDNLWNCEEEYKVKLKDNILIINAFTKIYAMAGLRLGYGVSSNVEMIKKISEYGAEWNVSVPAQLAGVEALKSCDYIKRTRDYIEKERKYLTDELRKIGMKILDAAANFILIEETYEKQIEMDTSKCLNLFAYLMEKGIMIRDCSNFAGLTKGYYRIAVRTHEENEVLIAALRQYRQARHAAVAPRDLP